MLFLPFLISVALAAPQYYNYYPQQQQQQQQQYYYPRQQQSKPQQPSVVYVQPPPTANPVPNMLDAIFKGVGIVIDAAGKIKPAEVATTPASSLVLHDQGLDFNSLLQGLFSSKNSQSGGL
ncbi:unnamed protein product [Caenorhabditis angaria]|uniref:Uncharacterized protein n=1 Tax=Caenorhabditis angaria TaxID=860376 RepID=A0A9P1ILG7_9PELO|nr:unnamed protein product [Caenorhabditis angaria]